MRYPKHTIFISILCGMLATLGGCTAEDAADCGNGTGNGRVPLTIRASISGFEGPAAAGNSLTRTPVENGNTTTFTAGDAIGLFAIKNGAIVDEINNSKLTYTEGADGAAGSWNPQTGTTLNWYDGVTYVAYYPYKNGITIDPAKTAAQIIAALAENSKLQPGTDQSTPDAYAACDLMTASSTPTADATNPARQVLTLSFKHQFCLLVLVPRVSSSSVECIAPANAGFVYRKGAKVPGDGSVDNDKDANSVVLNDVTACKMSDGSYRAIVKPTSGSTTLKGRYKTIKDRIVLYEGDAHSTGFAAGNCYSLNVDVPSGTVVVRPLAPGDFVFHGTNSIEVYPGNGVLDEDGKIPGYTDAVGIVVTCAQDRLTDDECNKKGWDHAYVMGLENCGSGAWGPTVNESVLTDISTREAAKEYMNGYTDTEKMLEAHKDDLSNYVSSLQAISDYRNDHVLAGLSSVRSPWFVPSCGQWFDVMANICKKSPDTFRHSAGTYADFVDSYYGAEMWNNINAQLNKVGKPLSLIANDQVNFYTSSEYNTNYVYMATWSGSNAATVRLQAWNKKYSNAKYVLRPFFAF